MTGRRLLAAAAAATALVTVNAPTGHAAGTVPVGRVVSAHWLPAGTAGLVVTDSGAYALGDASPVNGNPESSTIGRLLPSGRIADSVTLLGSLEGGVSAHGGLWFIRGDSARPEDFPDSLNLVELSPVSLRVLGQVYVGRGGGPYATDHAMWATPNLHSRLLRVDPWTLQVTGVRRFPYYLGSVAAAGSHVWVEEEDGDTPSSWLIGVDETTLRETLRVTLPDGAGGLAATTDRVFVLTGGHPFVVTSLDAASGKQLWHRAVGDDNDNGMGVVLAAAGDDSLWYLTPDGHLGHVAPSGRLAGAPIDLSRLRPYGVTATSTGADVLVAGGYVVVSAT